MIYLPLFYTSKIYKMCCIHMGIFPVLRLPWNNEQGLIQYHKGDKYCHQPKALLRVEKDRNFSKTDC